MEPLFKKLQDGEEKSLLGGESTKVEGGEFVITEVIDGDTLQGMYQGKKITARFIGINAPETGGPYRQKECLGEEATAYLKTLTTDTALMLEFDPSQGEYDKYGRLLAYPVATDGQNIGEQMILAGMAKEYTYKNTYQYQGLFKEAEEEAQKQKRGLWGDICQRPLTE
jgi:micrococcal nuclease